MEELESTELEEIKQDIREGLFKAITLDTCIFESQGLKLESGLIRQLEQFQNSATKLIISEVVRQEILSHLENKAKESKSEFEKSLKQIQNYWRIEEQVVKNIQNNLVFTNRQAQEIASERFDNFIELTELEIIEAQNHVMIGELLQMYFKSEPPFSATGKKKYEFPDAIALMSLEHWANENDTKIVVVTTDSDWKSFCKGSKRLIVIDDFAKALSLFQLQDADDICMYLSKRYEQNELPGLKNTILSCLEGQIGNLNFGIEASSNFRFDYDWPYMTINDYEFEVLESPNLIFRPINFDDDGLVAEAKLKINVNVECDFSFYVYDSVDGDEVALGSNSINTQEDLDVHVLVSFTGNLDKVGAEFEVGEVEVDQLDITIDFGEIEPDWMEDEDYHR